MMNPRTNRPCSTAVATLICAAALAASCSPTRPSCDVDYLNERFGGVAFLLERAGADGRFDHVYVTGGPIARAGGSWNRETGELVMNETYAAGLPALARDTIGTVELEPDGDWTASLSVIVSFGGDASERWIERVTRRGCTVEWTRVDDGDARIGAVTAALGSSTWSGGSFAVSAGAITNVSRDEAETASTTTLTDGTVTTRAGRTRLDWTNDLHVERDGPAVERAPDYVEDRTGAADGTAAGSYEWWRPDGTFEAGTLEQARAGDVVRTWIRYAGDDAETVVASGETTTWLDGSGEETYTTSGATAVTCSRWWMAEGAACTFACDDGSGGAC